MLGGSITKSFTPYSLVGALMLQPTGCAMALFQEKSDK